MPHLHPLALATALLLSPAGVRAQGTPMASAPRPASAASASESDTKVILQAEQGFSYAPCPCAAMSAWSMFSTL